MTQSNRILKANDIRSLGSKIAFNFEDVRVQCDVHVENARKLALDILDKAKFEAEKIRKQAQSDGETSGIEHGLRHAESEIENRASQLADQMAAERLKTTLPAIDQTAELLQQERDRWLVEWEASAIRLSIAIAEKIIRRKIETDPTIPSEMIAHTLQLAAGEPHITISLHPDDLSALGEHAEKVVESLASCGKATLVPDETMVPGGSLIETRHGIIDAQLETQLDRITTELIQQTL